MASAEKERLANIETQKSKITEQVQKLIAGMNKNDASFREYLAKAKELAVHSINETKRNDIKALLALKAYDFYNRAYYALRIDTQNKYEEFKTVKAGNNMENVPAAEELVNKYNALREKVKNRRQPPEIFEALRKAYIANEVSKDILSPAESRALAVTHENNIVFNDSKGELFICSLQPESNDLKLPALENEKMRVNIEKPKDAVHWVNSFAETEDRLFCGTRGGNIIYWEKDNWKESKLEVKYPGPVLSMVYLKNKKCLIYSVKNTIYRYHFDDKSVQTVDEQDNFIRAVKLVEGKENSVLIYADNNLYCRSLPGDTKEEERSIGSFNSKDFHSMAYNRSKGLLALGNETGDIHIAKIDFENLGAGNVPEFYPVEQKHEGIVRALAFSPNGRYLASGSLDGTIMLWKLKGNAKDKIPHPDHVLTINSKLKILAVAFDPKGEYIIFNDEQNLRICPTRPEVLYEKLRKKIGKKGLTPGQWKHYIGDSIQEAPMRRRKK